MPVAQTLVLRRVLMGGISMNSGCLVFFLAQYGSVVFGCRLWNGGVGGSGGLVFGTLLGPEATGPGFSRVCLFLVSWPRRSCTVVCAGCVVWGCCLRTT